MTAKRILATLAVFGTLLGAGAGTAAAASASTSHTAAVSAVPDTWYHL